MSRITHQAGKPAKLLASPLIGLLKINLSSATFSSAGRDTRLCHEGLNGDLDFGSDFHHHRQIVVALVPHLR